MKIEKLVCLPRIVSKPYNHPFPHHHHSPFIKSSLFSLSLSVIKTNFTGSHQQIDRALRKIKRNN